jgi:ABC-2 type transport system permease protein
MNTTLNLTKFSIKTFLRNKQAVFFTILSPLIIMIILGLIGFDKPKQFDVGLVSNNPQGQTIEFVDQLKKFESLKITEGSLDDELKALKDGDRSVVLNIPSDFISQQQVDQPKELLIYVNESKQGEAQAITSILSQYLDKTTLARIGAPTFFSIRQEVIDSKNLKYMDFLLPGLIAMSIMQMSVFSVAFVFTQYKEKGVLKRLLATPMKAYQFVTANVVTRLIVSILQAAVFIAVGVLLLDAQVIGSYGLVLLCVTLGALMFLGLGFTISGMSKTVDSVPAFANLFVFPMLFLGGVFFPISGMPDWLQKIAKVLPLTHFSSSLRDVTTKGASFGDIQWDILAMVIWSIILIGLATFTFTLSEKESA